MNQPAHAKASAIKANTDVSRVEPSILVIRGERVILDSDLAEIYGVETKRLNERVKRNAERFGDRYAFQLTPAEFDELKSQIATSNDGRGGRRSVPWAFTEHGVVMAATILDSEKAIQASKFVIEVFVEVKNRVAQKPSSSLIPALSVGSPNSALERLSGLGRGIGDRLQSALNHVLDSVIDHKQQSTVREEAQNLISESIQHLKERLKTQGLANEEIAARVVKLLAEAEKEKAVAAKTRAETEKLEFATIVRKLRLLLEVQRAIEHERVDDFLNVLKEMSEDS